MLTLTACAVTATSAQARNGSQYRIEGRGYGHGIGMSQYGANGYAKQGWTSDQIITHYYQGTVVADRPATGPTAVRVLLQSQLKPARVELLSTGTVTQGVATSALLAGDVLEMQSVGFTLQVTLVRGAARTLLLKGSAADAEIVPATDGALKALFTSDYTAARSGSRYRGRFTAHRYGAGVSIVNTLSLESYVRGVVGDEMPPSWNPEALKAQAIAARAYALTSDSPAGYNWFDMYADTRSQVYGGVNAEDARTDAAILATAGKVPRIGDVNGKVARTYFFSTSGGRTAANEQVWGSAPYTYLRSVESPYETESSKFSWSGSDLRRYTPAQLGAALGYAGTFRAAANTSYPSGYAQTVNIATTSGLKTMSGTRLQSKLGLPSSYFNIALLTIAAQNAVPAGGYARITGRAPIAGITQVQLRAGASTKLVTVKSNAKGVWILRARIAAPTRATIVRAGVPGPAITIGVA